MLYFSISKVVVIRNWINNDLCKIFVVYIIIGLEKLPT